MKIVLNKSRGKFSLSPEAIRLYGKYIGTPIYFYEQVRFRGRDKYNEWIKVKDTEILNKNILYLITVKDYGWSFRNIPDDIKYFDEDHISRVDENLIKVIKILGPDSFGKGSYLIIEDFNGNFDEVQIHDENGIETIYKSN